MRNEITSTAARLAADIGLKRVYIVGYHASSVVLSNNKDMLSAVAAQPGLKDIFIIIRKLPQAVPRLW